jgi:endonuclease III
MSAQDLVSLLSGDAASALDLDLASGADADRWFVAACLLTGRVRPEVARACWRALERAGLSSPEALAEAGPERVALALDAAGHPKPEGSAIKLARACAALEEQWQGSVARVGTAADDLDDLGRRLAQLAPGIGPATILTFLRPLRDLWPAARETPISPAAQAAAVHLGWIRAGEDDSGEPGALRAALAAEADAPPLAAVEAALDALGRRACLRERAARCPVTHACPLHAASVAQPQPQE